ncbi:TlpA disulfide reductase family protein [Sediminibacter sp. Hel_I_10]|uniref:TlpA disulfide reductase family protein n=1 Tax=Sediminibacter sp. Hel_I_10 TaxID=1392490 RepID=UPI000AB3AE43|nr:TlpA disulfide reductase family protein [Sediminibacter sp. Hel_I_10]
MSSNQANVSSSEIATDSLEVYDFNGLEKYLNRSDDKIYVVNFWATWCAPCVKELPYFEQLNVEYAKDNVEVILVSLDFPSKYDSNLKPYIREKQLKSKVIALNDTDSNTWIPKVDENWSGAIPATIIYNKDKRKFYEKSFDYQALEKEVKQFLN